MKRWPSAHGKENNGTEKINWDEEYEVKAKERVYGRITNARTFDNAIGKHAIVENP